MMVKRDAEGSRVEMSNKTLAKLAYLMAFAHELRQGDEVIGPTVRKSDAEAISFDEVRANQGRPD
ncbi:MAG: hypothetical protein CMJ50_00160 [Planctomycetaceae bacterium]|nr:hypothetical protein [Planctomycetaceae bacterium]